MLSGDYPCSAYIGNDQQMNKYCKLCQSLHPYTPAPVEDMVHLIAIYVEPHLIPETEFYLLSLTLFPNIFLKTKYFKNQTKHS